MCFLRGGLFWGDWVNPGDERRVSTCWIIYLLMPFQMSGVILAFDVHGICLQLGWKVNL
jgi:hypothetical protein